MLHRAFNGELRTLRSTCPPFVLRSSRHHIRNPSVSHCFCCEAAGPLSFRSLTIDPHPIVGFSSPSFPSKEPFQKDMILARSLVLAALCIFNMRIGETNCFLFST